MRYKLSSLALPFLLLFAAVAFTGSNPAPTHAGNGGPTFNPHLSASVADDTAGAISDFTASVTIDSGDVQFATIVTYIPAAWQPGTDPVPIGAAVGELDSAAVLGLLNGACNTNVPVHFDFQNAGIDQNDTVSYDDQDGDGTPDFAEDEDGNGTVDAVDRYLDFLSRIFPTQQPVKRYAAVTHVSGIPILLQLLIFLPGTEVYPGLPHDAAMGFPTVTVLANIGDPTPIVAPSAITDFCTPLVATVTSFGRTPEGVTLFRNPAAPGTYTFTAISLGQRDADLDTFENSTDTCAFDPNAGDPRVTNGGDEDGDGLDAACDPNDSLVFGDGDCNGSLTIGDAQKTARKLIDLPVNQEAGCAELGTSIGLHLLGDVDCNGVLNIGDAQKTARKLVNLDVSQETGCPGVGEPGTNSDEDGDAYLNRGDNCPLVANGAAPDNQRDTDMDQIGDACDPAPTTPDGDYIFASPTADVQIATPPQ